MGSLTNKRVLITAGPTHEYLDPVRYFGNAASGRLGFALARVARDRGAQVTIIAGPCAQKTPAHTKRIDVTSALEMHKACLTHAKRNDIIIMSAAVADYRPAKPQTHKIKKTAKMALSLIKNPDILAAISKNRRKNQFIVGFALESQHLLKNAQGKIATKGCDIIVANSPKAIDAAKQQATLVWADHHTTLPALTKLQLARKIIQAITSS